MDKIFDTSILSKIHNQSVFWAHIDGSREYETLIEHTELVLYYFAELLRANDSDTILKNLLNNIKFKYDEVLSESHKLISEMFLAIPVYHDLGKINPGFQKIKMKNAAFFDEAHYDSHHSVIGKIIFLNDFINKILNFTVNEEEQSLLLIFVFGFANVLNSHHSNIIKNNYRQDSYSEWLERFKNYYPLINKSFKQAKIEQTLFEPTFASCHKGFQNKLTENISGYSMFSLFKFNYSLLTAADYYATNEFMNGHTFTEFGIADNNFKNEFIKGIYEISYNKKLKTNHIHYILNNPDEIKETSLENLNLLRTGLACEMINNIRENPNSKLYYIEAPTGSGKTNLSALAAAELFRLRKEPNKIFYVFPFINLITQTVNFFEKIKLDKKFIGEIHSRYVSDSNESNGIEEADADYGNKKKNYIDFIFANYPLVFISHIRFFEILVTGRKQPNYLYHRLANSLVIIDEIQAYDPYEWPKITYLMEQMADKFNVTFIVMSATLPHIGDISSGEMVDKFFHLIPKEKKRKFFINPNFSKRVEINTDYLHEKYEHEKLKKWIIKQSGEYRKKHGKVLTIVEFLTKKRASEFYNKVKFGKDKKEKSEIEIFFDEIYLISGTILEPRRKQIIKVLKNANKSKKNILVIATQVIEAGVDIDMDIGFKDSSFPDFDEQLAGRINRNSNKKDCKLFLFRTDDAAKVYKNNEREKVIDEIDEQIKHKALVDKDFEPFYKKLLDLLNIISKRNTLNDNLNAFKSDLNSLNFHSAEDNLKLIKQKNFQFFVPLDIELEHLSDYNLFITKLDDFSKSKVNHLSPL
ncbi:MAG: CRISPR-associated helicase Cas3', partial [bacterium]